MIVIANFISALLFFVLFLILRAGYLDFYFAICMFVGVVVFWLVSSFFGLFVYGKYSRSFDLRYVMLPVSLVLGLCAREISPHIGSTGYLIVLLVGCFFGLLCLFFCRYMVNDLLRNIAATDPGKQPKMR